MSAALWEGTCRSMHLRFAIGTLLEFLPGVGRQHRVLGRPRLCPRPGPSSRRVRQWLRKRIAAPEAANNATVGGATVPLLALGVPVPRRRDHVGALIMHGLHPGPQLFNEAPSRSYRSFSERSSRVAVQYAGALFSCRSWPGDAAARRGDRRRHHGFAVLGAFAIRNLMFDVYLNARLRSRRLSHEEAPLPGRPRHSGYGTRYLVEYELSYRARVLARRLHDLRHRSDQA